MLDIFSMIDGNLCPEPLKLEYAGRSCQITV